MVANTFPIERHVGMKIHVVFDRDFGSLVGHDSEGSVNWSDLRPGKGMVRPLSCHLSARFQGNNDTASEPLNNFKTIEIIAHELLDKIRVNTTIGWQTTRTSAKGQKRTSDAPAKYVHFRG